MVEMIFSKIKALVIMLLGVMIISCSDSDTISNGEDNNQGGGLSVVVPVTTWGKSSSEIKSKHNDGLQLSVSSDTLLRYTDKTRGIVVDYSFKEDKLIGTSLTQANISNIDNVVRMWLNGYNKLAKSEKAFLYATQNNSTLAFGKIFKGNECDYASIAWTYIDENEVANDGPDFSPSGKHNGYDYVDLGVGIGWAVQNVGASSPGQSGGYYMWAETTTKSNCWWWYYSLYKGSIGNYRDDSKFYVPHMNISKTAYDVARVKMGGSWRMPTRAELSTLVNNCEFEEGEYNGVKGMIVTGPSGKSIFLPKTGRKRKTEIENSRYVYLWSSSYERKPDAYILEDNKVKSDYSFYGIPVRGVVDL